MVDDKLSDIDSDRSEAAVKVLLLAERYRFRSRLSRLLLCGQVAHTLDVLHLLDHRLGFPGAAKQFKCVILPHLLSDLIQVALLLYQRRNKVVVVEHDASFSASESFLNLFNS